MSNEPLLPLVDAVEKATGQRPHLSTCLRWCSRGSAGVRLECRVLGGRRMTSTEAVLRYVDAVTAAKDGGDFHKQSTPRQETLAAKRAAKQLAKRVR